LKECCRFVSPQGIEQGEKRTEREGNVEGTRPLESVMELKEGSTHWGSRSPSNQENSYEAEAAERETAQGKRGEGQSHCDTCQDRI